MGNLSNHHKISCSGLLHSFIVGLTETAYFDSMKKRAMGWLPRSGLVLQYVINIIHDRQTSAPQPTFRDRYFIDRHDHAFYTAPHKKEVIINNYQFEEVRASLITWINPIT